MKPTITYKQLALLGACDRALVRFNELFGEEVEVTEALCATYAVDFDWRWAGVNLLKDGFNAGWLPSTKRAVAFAQCYRKQCEAVPVYYLDEAHLLDAYLPPKSPDQRPNNHLVVEASSPASMSCPSIPSSVTTCVKWQGMAGLPEERQAEWVAHIKGWLMTWGCYHFRVSRPPYKPEDVYVEGWECKPEDEGAYPWQTTPIP